jgi:hypothetical protein
MVVRWRYVTLELVAELYQAREALSHPGKRSDLVTDDTRLQTWSQYLTDVGLHRMTAHRWLERYLPEEQKLLTTEEAEERKRITDRAHQAKSVATMRKVKEARATGHKPGDRDASAERQFERRNGETRHVRARAARVRENTAGVPDGRERPSSTIEKAARGSTRRRRSSPARPDQDGLVNLYPSELASGSCSHVGNFVRVRTRSDRLPCWLNAWFRLWWRQHLVSFGVVLTEPIVGGSPGKADVI